jgi:hypothetical protein
MKLKLVDQDGKEVLFRKGMGLLRYYSEPGLARIALPPGEGYASVCIAAGDDATASDRKIPLDVAHLYEVARLIAAILGMDVVKDTGINPSAGEGWRFV